MKSLYVRTLEESEKYKSALIATIDHLKMAHSHYFEETEGRDIDNILSDINKIIEKLEKI
jgi:restriction endonuclease